MELMYVLPKLNSVPLYFYRNFRNRHSHKATSQKSRCRPVSLMNKPLVTMAVWINHTSLYDGDG